MKKTALAVCIVVISCLQLFAATQKRGVMTDASNAAPAYTAPATSLEGKAAIGAGVNGVGYRYWVSNTNAWDANLGFSTSNDDKELNFGGTFLTILRSTRNLRFMSMFSLQYGNTSTTVGNFTTKQDDIKLGAGLDVEFFLSELPDLGFNATLTGITLDFGSTDNGGGSTSSTTLATVPVVSFGVRYYYK
jgi:hypothetical protein